MTQSSVVRSEGTLYLGPEEDIGELADELRRANIAYMISHTASVGEPELELDGRVLRGEEEIREFLRANA